MSDIDKSLNDPFGSKLLFTLDKTDTTQLDFNVNSRIDIEADKQQQRDYLNCVYFKNRWLTDQLEVKDMKVYADRAQLLSAIVLTGTPK